MRTTLIDPFEIRYRAKQKTLIDPFEVDDLEDWEQPTRDECRVIVEECPRGIGYDGWRRARSWGADESALRR